MTEAGVTRALAEEMQRAYEDVSPFIESHTSRVCPSCAEVCCIDRHGTHEREDIAFIRALGEKPPREAPLSEDTLPCRQLCDRGCGLPRWKRPFRCTWYFCSALLESMPAEDPRGYREFMHRLRRLQSLRQEVWTLCGGAG